MRLPYASTHTHVTTVPARLRSNGLHPSSRPHRPCPGADYERLLREERLRRVRLCLTGDAYGRMQQAAGATALPANHQRPPPDVSETCWLSGLTEHALSQATFWASQALALLLAGRNVHSCLEPKVPKVPPPTSPSCPPGSVWLSAYLPACCCWWLAVRWGL